METIGKALDEHYDGMQNLTVLCAKLKVPNVFGTIAVDVTDYTPSVIQVWNFDNFLKLMSTGWFYKI